jgi:hypothetical protein
MIGQKQRKSASKSAKSCPTRARITVPRLGQHSFLENRRRMKFHNYYVYITTNPKKTVLYVGVTNDLDRRMEEHYEDCFGGRKTFVGRYYCYHLIY